MNELFLTYEEILELHLHQIDKYGGQHGIRDENLLLSAIAQPQATFDHHYLHPTLPDMAAAYMFHLICNHPFIDGNKRIGLAAAISFLRLNDIKVVTPQISAYDVAMGVANGQVSKRELAEWCKTLC